MKSKLDDKDIEWLRKNIGLTVVCVGGEVDQYTDWLGGLLAENTSLKARIEKLRHALRFYAYDGTYVGNREHLHILAKEALEADKPSS